MKKIIVFGGLNLDVSVRSDTVPTVGDYLVGSDFVSAAGGKGGNQAVAAARMGADTFMVGKVGNDHHGRRITAELTNHGVSVMNVSVTARAATGVALVVRCGGGYFTVTDPGANAKMSYEEVRAAIHGLGQHRNIFLMTSGADFQVSMDALACAKRNGLYTILNHAGDRQLPDEAYKDLDLLIVNRTDTARLTGIRPANDELCEMALNLFLDKGVRNVIILLKDRGSATMVDGTYVRVPGYKVDVVDASIGGDTYVGGLASQLAEGVDLVEGMRFATAAAALSLTKVGAQQSIPSWAEVNAFIQEQGSKA